MSTPELSGKVVVITGATSGIGLQCAVTLAGYGANVVVTGRKAARGQKVVEGITANGGQATFVALDVTDPKAWHRAVAEIERAYGRLDVLVNNAGESVAKPIGELEASDLVFLLKINVEAAFLGLRAVTPLMRKNGGGLVINVSSVAALRAAPRNSIYGATKAALSGMSRGAAHALRSAGIRVIPLHPGLIWGEGVEDSLGKEGAQRFLDFILPKTPLRRVGVPSDIAETVAYLATDDAAFISGHDVTVDGGLWLSYP